MSARRVAVTGLGVVSAAGRDLVSFWRALTAPAPVFHAVERFDAKDYRTRVGGEIPGGEGDCFVYALAAAKAALADAGLKAPEGAGIALGTTSADEWLLEKIFAQSVDSGAAAEEAFAKARELSPANLPARLALALGLRGPNAMLTTACAAGNYAVAYSFDRLRAGACEAMLAGGVDVFAPVIFAGFNRLLAVAPERCAPFSKGRLGLIPGEGCGMLVLEDWEAARRRGARIYAEVLGYGASSDASHVTMPSVDGVARAIADCLARCGLSPDDVDYVNAHGTGTPANDKTETAALKRVLGARSAKIPVSSIKSVLGHAMGAASAFEAAACCLTLSSGVLPPTAAHVPGDPDCDLDYVGEGARKTDPKIVLSDAFAFGGSNAVLALARPDARRTVPSSASSRVVITAAVKVEPCDALAEAAAQLPDKDLGYLDVPMAYALCAVKKALSAAGLPDPAGEDVGIVLESSGEWESLFRFYKDLRQGGPQNVEPRLFPNVLANAAASRAAIAFGLKRLNMSLAGAFPGGELAVAAAFQFLRARGPGALVAGFVGDGAALYALETAERAAARGARVLAEIVDASESFDRLGPVNSTLAHALAQVSRGMVAAECEVSGLWGGRVRLSLRPSEIR